VTAPREAPGGGHAREPREAQRAQAAAPDGNALTSVDEHLADVLAAIRPLPPTELGLAEAEGCVLAEDATARCPLPPFDNSAMDGYALRSADVAGASEHAPVTLPVTGQVTAGDTGAYAVAPGTCLRITTGALLPGGADAVVPVELTDAGLAKVTIRTAVEPGTAIRRSGGDARAGDVLLTAGTRLGPMQIAVLAASGHGRVVVRPRPRVVVLSTGNELAEPGTPVVPGRIWDSNSFMLAAAAREAGCLAYRHAALPDDPLALLPAIEDQLVRADLLVTSGGVSMGGEHDVVKETLRRLGTVTFRKVAMQPGMPQGFGTIGEDRTPIFTLPGNPVSAYVSFQLFVRPALGALQGDGARRLPAVRAALTGPVRSPAAKRSFLRGVLDSAAGTVTPLSGQGSHQVAALGRANALIVVPEGVAQMGEGDTADVLCLP
jgi:molybdopterin molybdotransferase